MEGLTWQSWHFMSTGFVLFNVAYIPSQFLNSLKRILRLTFRNKVSVTNAKCNCWPNEEKWLLAWALQLKETLFFASPLLSLNRNWHIGWSMVIMLWLGRASTMASAQCKNLLMTSFLAVRFSQAHERKANDDDEDAEKNQDGVCYTKVSVSTVNPNMKTLTLLSSSALHHHHRWSPLEQQQRTRPEVSLPLQRCRRCKFVFLWKLRRFKWRDLLYIASHRLPISIF